MFGCLNKNMQDVISFIQFCPISFYSFIFISSFHFICAVGDTRNDFKAKHKTKLALSIDLYNKHVHHLIIYLFVCVLNVLCSNHNKKIQRSPLRLPYIHYLYKLLLLYKDSNYLHPPT